MESESIFSRIWAQCCARCCCKCCRRPLCEEEAEEEDFELIYRSPHGVKLKQLKAKHCELMGVKLPITKPVRSPLETPLEVNIAVDEVRADLYEPDYVTYSGFLPHRDNANYYGAIRTWAPHVLMGKVPDPRRQPKTKRM